MDVWLNGAFVPLAEAKVSAVDAGLQHGVGLFETMQARHGRIFRIASHLDRLATSASELDLTRRVRIDPLADAVEQTLERNGMEDARVRLTLTAGDLNILREPGREANDPTILIVAQPPTKYPDAFFEQGILATIADARLNPLEPSTSHKTLHYWPRLRALQGASASGAGECLWFTVSNHLAGGSVSNIMLVRDGVVQTPIARGEEDHEAGQQMALPSAVLPGITRSAVIEAAADLGHDIERRMLDINDLLAADEVFLTNSSWGVLPVVAVERESIGSREVGPVTRRLREAWLKLVDEETREQANW